MDLEKNLIGVLLHKPDSLVNIARIVSERDFSTSEGVTTFSLILSMWRDSNHIDLVTVSARNIKLASYLSEAFDVIPSEAAAIQYAHDIAKAARARRIDQGLKEIQAKHKSFPQFTLDELSSLYHREAIQGQKDGSISKITERLKDTIDQNRINGSAGIQTGFDFLDDLRVEYCKGHIWTMAGFTSVGKTAVMVEKIHRVKESASIVVISTEMTEEQLVSRQIARMTGLSGKLILSGRVDGHAKLKIDKAIDHLASLKMAIYDDVYELNDIEAVCKKAHMQGGVDIIFIDYVQNCQVPDAKSSYQEQATLAKRLQKLAKDVEANIVCLSQVSNSVGRGDTDQLEMKGAGEWAAVSDVSIMLKRNKMDDRKLMYRVAKHRHGAKHGDEGQILRYENGYTKLLESQNNTH